MQAKLNMYKETKQNWYFLKEKKAFHQLFSRPHIYVSQFNHIWQPVKVAQHTVTYFYTCINSDTRDQSRPASWTEKQ